MKVYALEFPLQTHHCFCNFFFVFWFIIPVACTFLLHFQYSTSHIQLTVVSRVLWYYDNRLGIEMRITWRRSPNFVGKCAKLKEHLYLFWGLSLCIFVWSYLFRHGSAEKRTKKSEGAETEITKDDSCRKWRRWKSTAWRNHGGLQVSTVVSIISTTWRF